MALTDLRDFRRAIITQKDATGGILLCQGQSGAVFQIKPVECVIFLVLSLFSNCLSLKSLSPNPTKVIFME